MTIRTPHVVASCLGFLAGVVVASFGYAAGYLPSLTFTAAVAVMLVLAVWEFVPTRTSDQKGTGAFSHSSCPTPSHSRRAITLIAVIAFGLGLIRFSVAAAGADGSVSAPSGRATVELEGRVIQSASTSTGRWELQLVNVVAGRRASNRDRAAAEDDQRASRHREPPTTPRPAVRLSSTTGFSRPVRVTLPSAPDPPAYGDTVRVRCLFRQPEHLRDRLTVSGTCAAFRPGDLRVLGQGGGSPTIRAILRLHRALVASVDQLLPEPAAGIVAGMVLGVRRSLDGDLLDAFRRTGVIHILVVSGFHMTFIGLRFRRWLLKLGILPRSTTAWVALAILALYVVMVGLQPSAVRGALVVVAILAADLLGRVGNPVRALLLIATAMVAVHPHTLGFDLGFQLSFAAAAALILLAPILDAWLRAAWRRAVGWLPKSPHVPEIVMTHIGWMRAWGEELRDLLAASIAASLATAPLLIGAFGTITPISPLVNIPVLLLVPLLMGFGVGLIIAAFVVPPFAIAIAWVLGVLVSALTAIVLWAQRLPGAGTMVGQADWWFVLGLETLLAIAVLLWYRDRHLHILSPFLASDLATVVSGGKNTRQFGDRGDPQPTGNEMDQKTTIV